MRRLAAALLLLPLWGCQAAPTGSGSASAGDGGAPELALSGVTVRHVAADGARGTVEAARATYSLSSRLVRAEAVSASVPRDGGEATLSAPAAEWGTDSGVLRFPAGVTAALGGSYRAELSKGEADLRGRTLRGEGKAVLSGPGVTVAGEGLAWDLKAGKGTLGSPRARVAPGSLPGKG